jgi:hypothetical protein
MKRPSQKTRPPAVSVCVAGYHDPADPAKLVRSTAIAVDRATDRILERIEAPDDAAAEQWSSAILAMVERFDAQLVMLDASVPLEVCECCGQPIDRFVTSEGLARSHHSLN